MNAPTHLWTFGTWSDDEHEEPDWHRHRVSLATDEKIAVQRGPVGREEDQGFKTWTLSRVELEEAGEAFCDVTQDTFFTDDGKDFCEALGRAALGLAVGDA